MGEDSESRHPPGLSDILGWRKKEEERRKGKKGRPPRTIIHERLDLDDYDPAKRKRKYPPGHKLGIPGTTTAGPPPRRPDDER